MALRVGLPLNGDLENIGVSGVNIEQVTTATFSNAGKIGKCLSGGKIKINATDVAKIFNNNAMTITFGYNNNTTTADTHAICGFSGNTEGDTDAVRSGDFFQYSTKNDFHGSMGTLGGGVLNGIIIDNTGTHFAINFNGSKVQIYINGELKNEHAGTSNFTFDKSYYIFSNHNQLINDFRIYDHCLSAKEIKEISQGLILHYKLDEIIGNNLLLNSDFHNGKTNGSGVNSSVLSIVQKDGTQTITATKGTTNNLFCQSSQGTHTAGQTTVFTFSARIYSELTGTITGSLFIASDGGKGAGSFNGKNNNINIGGNEVEATVTANTATYTGPLIVCIGFSNTTFFMANPKFEKGTAATGWSLANSEIGGSYIPDCSGYGNDGYAVDVTTEQITPGGRYGICTNMLGTTVDSSSNTIIGAQYIYAQFAYPATSAITYTWGGNNIAYGRGGILETTATTGNIGEGSDYSTTAIANGDSTFGIYNGTTRVNIYSVFPKTDATWHHHAIVFNGTNVIYYKDGVAAQTSALTGTLPAITGFKIGLGRAGGVYRQIKQKMSDFRIYATALSAEDILDLYHTPANIDNLQNIHAFELKEQSGNMFAGSPMTGTVTGDATNNYYTITSNPSTSTWGIGPAVGTSPKKIIPGGMSYILTYEVYSPTAAQGYIDYNNNDLTTSLSGNDNDNGRLRTGVNVPANTGTLITYGCSNTNETKNPDHLPLYDYSTGLGPVMTNISNAITWHMRNPQGYLVDADNKEHVYENGVFQANFLKEDNQSSYTSFRNEEKAAGAHGYIEK